MLNDAVSSLQKEMLSTLQHGPRALVLAWLEVPETPYSTQSGAFKVSSPACTQLDSH